MSADKVEETYFKIVGLPKPPDISLEELAKRKFLLDEDIHREVNIGQAAIGYLKKALGPVLTKVDNSRLRILILPSWKHYNDFCINCMDVDLYLLETDFSNASHAAGELQKLNRDFDRRKLTEELAGAMNGTYGLSFLAAGSFIILVDSNIHRDGKKILHEFTHYVQKVTGKLILGDDIKEEVKEYFNLDDQYARYMLNEREFWANIYNDLFNGLQKIYWLKFKNVYSWEKFIEFHFTDLKRGAYDWMKSAVRLLWNECIGGNDFYVRILSSISYVKPEFFDEIVEKLKNRD